MWRYWSAVVGLGLLFMVSCSGSSEAEPSAAVPQAPPAAATAAPTATAGSNLGAAVAPTDQTHVETKAPTTPTSTATAVPAPSVVQTPVPPQPGATNPPAAVPALPLLVLTSPAEQTTEVSSGTKSITVAGRSRDDAVVSVNGELVVPDDRGDFRIEVPLSDEVTLVEVIASDAAGRLVREQRVVVRE